MAVPPPTSHVRSASRPRCPFARSRTLALLAALGGTAAACGGGSEGPTVPTTAVERGRIERIVVATGTIEPVREVEVRPRIAGIIEKIHVDPGDDVERGDPLVEIERELLASRAREAEARLREAQVERRYADIELERLRELEASGAASPKQGDAARARAERAAAAVARSEAALDTLETQLGYATVRSPLSGRVLDVFEEEGSAVSPVTSVTGGTVLLSLAATESLHLEGLVDENEVSRVRVGQPARIRTEAYGDRVFEGVVREIAPLGERVQNVTYFEVKVTVTDPESDLLRPRMSADGDIVTETLEDAVLVPETALRYRGDDVYALVENGDGSAQERVLEIGVVEGDRVQVVRGLAPGERVRLQ